MRVLVTGGAGFIGSHIVDALIASAHEVVVLDNLDPFAHDGEPDYLNPAADYLWGDCASIDDWRRACAGVDAVCHQAAKVGLGVDFGDVTAYASANDMGTAAGLEALHERRFTGRLVFASSMVVYGEGRYLCTRHGVIRPRPRAIADLDAGRYDPLCPLCGRGLVPVPIPEDAPLEPRNVYAATKLHTEHLCEAYAREHPGTTTTALRYHNVYGPRMPSNTPYAGVTSIFRSAYERGEAPRVYEDGGQRRDFVHVDDVARANIAALTRPEPAPGAFNVCSGTPRTVLDMAVALSRAYGPTAPIPQVVGGYRLGDVRHVFASPERARDQLDFAASVTFEAGMKAFAGAALRRPPRPR